jgi:PhzF family phenazine biosynthesis protein
MKIPLYQVDAFSNRPFAGNPAAICPLEKWLPDEVMQSIATENNLSETAFYVRDAARYDLRWFTPAVEVDLCGHATLAAACVILDIRRETADPRIVFRTKSGELAVERDGDSYALDFPSRPPQPCVVHPGLAEALGAAPKKVLAARDYLCVFETEEQVVALAPDMAKLAEMDRFAVIVTAPGRDCDFISRFFAPSAGVPEDPVTGSAHSTLIPYWAEQLGKTKLFARQRSRRGGELWCELRGDRVRIAGHAARYMQGAIEFDGVM